jgi:putative addiction module killer protein
MVEVLQTREFSVWLSRLRDDNALVRIVARIRRMEKGNPGDARSVGSGVTEMRIDYGPGYRVYYVQRGSSCFCAEVTSAHSSKTSSRLSGWHRNHDEQDHTI